MHYRFYLFIGEHDNNSMLSLQTPEDFCDECAHYCRLANRREESCHNLTCLCSAKNSSSNLAESPQTEIQITAIGVYEYEGDVRDPIGFCSECGHLCARMNKRGLSCINYICICASKRPSSSLAESLQIDFQRKHEITYEDSRNRDPADFVLECKDQCARTNKRTQNFRSYICLCAAKNLDLSLAILSVNGL